MRLNDVWVVDLLVVRTKEHTDDRNLYARSLGQRKEPGQLLQALGIREVLTGERVECADLDFGVAQAGDARRRRAKLPGVGQRTVAKVDLRHFEVAVSRARQRGQNLGPRRRAAEAGEDGCLRERRGWAERSL